MTDVTFSMDANLDQYATVQLGIVGTYDVASSRLDSLADEYHVRKEPLSAMQSVSPVTRIMVYNGHLITATWAESRLLETF